MHLTLASIIFSSKLNSVERFYDYRKIALESFEAPDGFEKPTGWPANGKLEFDEFTFRYRSV